MSIFFTFTSLKEIQAWGEVCDIIILPREEVWVGGGGRGEVSDIIILPKEKV